MYSIFTYIYHKNHLNVGKSLSPTDPIGKNLEEPSSPKLPWRLASGELYGAKMHDRSWNTCASTCPALDFY